MSLIWKNRMWRLYQQYAHVEEVESFEPEIARAREAYPKIWTDGTYKYQMSKDGSMIIRIHKNLTRAPETMQEPPLETHKHRRVKA